MISLGVSLIIVDSTIVNVAVPSIIDDIGITSTQAQWVQEIYTLVFAGLLLVFGGWPTATAVIPSLAANPATAAVAEAAQVAYTDATRLAALVAAGFLVVGLAASASLGRVPRRHEKALTPVAATSSSEGTA